MTKPEVVLRLLASLEERVALLEKEQAQDLATLTADPIRWNGVLHLLQVCVEIVVDIAAHIVVDWPAQVPDSHRLILLKLGELGVIPVEFAVQIAPMTTFRNIVVHNYLTVDPARVMLILQTELPDFRRYMAYILEHLRTTGSL